LSAVIEHHPAGDESRRTTLATVEITQEGRNRGLYRARFTEDTLADHATEPFLFLPKYLRPAELLLHASLVRLTGQHAHMPPRPGLAVPEAVERGGLRYVPIHRLVEPARTGFLRWLERFSELPLAVPGASMGLAPEPLYVQFLKGAV
jgi:hypothetical protein